MTSRPQAQSVSLLDIVTRTIVAHNLLQPGDRVLVAVSGGPDSVALLHVLIQLRSRFKISLAVAHLNHQLRGEASRRDADFVDRLAKRWQIPCISAAEDVHLYRAQHRISLEEAGRRLRYRFLRQTAGDRRCQKIALGHHRDDTAELILMNLLRGVGIQGLTGIHPIRPGGIVRPLIEADRDQIMTYLRKRSLDFVTDITNADRRFLRNSIRHELLPMLSKRYNPNITAGLNRLAAIARDENDWIETQVETLFQRVCTQRTSRKIVLAARKFRQLHIAMQRRLLRHAIGLLVGNKRRIGYTHVSAALDLIKTKAATKSIDLPHQMRILFSASSITLRSERRPLRQIDRRREIAAAPAYNYRLASAGTVRIAESGQTIKLGVIGRDRLPAHWPATPLVAHMGLDCITFPVIIRNPRPGDRFQPLGMDTSQSLQTFLKHQKVDPQKRRTTPLVVDSNRILWVAGYRIDSAVQITAETEHVLKGELVLA